jgi:predicted neuraminidase
MDILNTMTVSEFKAANNCETMQVVESPKTGKLFVACKGKTLAAVSKAYDSTLPDKEFIQCKFDDVDEPIWVLHNPSNTNVRETL